MESKYGNDGNPRQNDQQRKSNSIIEKAQEYCAKTTSLKWYDIMMMDMLRFYKGESMFTLQQVDIRTFCNMYEYMQMHQYLEEVQNEELEKERNAVRK